MKVEKIVVRPEEGVAIDLNAVLTLEACVEPDWVILGANEVAGD